MRGATRWSAVGEGSDGDEVSAGASPLAKSVPKVPNGSAPLRRGRSGWSHWKGFEGSAAPCIRRGVWWVVYDLRASWAVRDAITRAGGTHLENRVGHAFIKRRMREIDAVFAGEVSGHYYFRDFSYSDTGLIPALLMLEMIATGDTTLSRRVAAFRERYHISGEINATVGDAPGAIQRVRERFADGRQAEIDELSVDYDGWRFNVRSSNTEPLLRLNLESLVSEADMERRRDEVLEVIHSG